MPVIAADRLTRAAETLLGGLGAAPDEAATVAGLLVKADLWGVHSHGVRAINMYAGFVRSGAIVPRATPRVVRQTAATALVDGAFGFGQTTCRFAMQIAIAKAREAGVAWVGVYNCNHAGSLADYPMMAAERGLVGHMVANSASVVAPFGGIKPILGTNPMCWAFPTGGPHPIVFDAATSAITWGALAARHRKGEQVEPGLILDAEGQPTTDPARYFAEPGGAILPMANHKGYGLGLVVDFLGGALPGTGCGGAIGWEAQGVSLMALDPACFGDPAAFRDHLDRQVARLKAVPRAAGTAEILLPGEKEHRLADDRRRNGIPLDDVVWADLGKLAAELKVALP